ncbi:hypothetical protein CDD81_7065 [Ophiocordyceps australis]|uniref:Histidine-specific methyltransferase SAM-dependent domain-containing protein n=1 Tax=Ophiocordyceps australis TaxID=1399860 RepID=A0A2C5Y5H8_9HYPO|nr:hypothetical protein CDD81_7065 [Ophiocordyceps australis]
MPVDAIIIDSKEHLHRRLGHNHKPTRKLGIEQAFAAHARTNHQPPALESARWPICRLFQPHLPLSMAGPATATLAPRHGAVVDIGGSAMNDDVGHKLACVIQTPCSSTTVEKPTLPDECLYDDIGLPIWNEIIQTPEFYQTHDEIALFDLNGPEIVANTKPGTTLIDLGAGDTGKVQHLLEAFQKANKPVTYLALDISKASLDLNIAFLEAKHPVAKSSVTCAGLWGDFHKGKEYAQRIKGPRLFLSLGSVLCNDEWCKALHHLKYWADIIRPEDQLLVGMDGHLLPKDGAKLWAAYHSRDDLYRQFFLNGFDHANRLLGEKVFREADWDFQAQLEDKPTTRHRFFFVAKRDIRIKNFGRIIKRGEEWDWFDSHKYGESDVNIMCSKAGLRVVKTYQAPNSEFRQYLIKTRDPSGLSEDADSAVSGLSA